jgi:enoyl-CoA hydratase/carnithine racemase
MEPLLVERRGTVRWLLLNRPERRNALDIALIEALDKQITSAEADPGDAVIAGAGRGPSFCAGGTSTSSWSCTSGATTRSTSWPIEQPAQGVRRDFQADSGQLVQRRLELEAASSKGGGAAAGDVVAFRQEGAQSVEVRRRG